MIEIAPGIFQWSWYSEEKKLDFNGLLVEGAGERVLVDPPPGSPEDEAAIQARGKISAVIVTNLHHSRASARWREISAARIVVPRADRGGFTIAVDADYAPGDRLPCGLLAIGLEAMKTAGETALHLDRDRGVMILGDSLIGKPPGALSLLPPEKVREPARARESLRKLLEYRWDMLLLGDGQSILRGGRAALEMFLKQSE